MQRITSKDNDLIKHIKKLKEKKYRDESNEFVVEGVKIVEEAINEGANIKQIIICDESEKTSEISKGLMYEIAKYECIYVPKKVFDTITDVNTPQGIMAVVERKNLNKLIDLSQDIIVALDDIQDPGNLGTILRTIDSAGLNQIIVTNKTADAYNPKVVRSTMGAIFRINIIESDNLEKTLKQLQKENFEIAVTLLQTDNNMYDVCYNKKVIVIGNEANGVSKEIQDMADIKVKIPMLGKAESLNASVATSIIVYEYVRQKISKNGKGV